MESGEDIERKRAQARLSAAAGPVARALKAASALHVAATLAGFVQFALVAWLFSGLVSGTSPAYGYALPIAGFAAIGILRALVARHADGMAFRAASTVVSIEREKLIGAQSRISGFSPGAPGSAEVAALAGDKIAMLAPYLMRYAPAMTRTRIVPLVILALAFSMSWAIGVIFLITGPLIPVFMALIGMAAQSASEKQMQEIGTLNTLLFERIRALPDIRLLDAASQTVAGLQRGADALRRQTMAVLRIAFLSSTVLELFSAIGVALVAVYVGFVLLGEIGFGSYGTRLTLFEGLFLLLLAPEFYQPLRDLAAAWHDKASALAVAGELDTLETTPAKHLPGTGGKPDGPPLAGDIAAQGLVHALPDGRRIVFPDIGIRQGERIAVTGASGIGKSTLLAILAGLLEPGGGTIRIGGETLSPDNADRWRASLAWIGQSPHFLNLSLRGNLAIAMDGGSAEDIRRALENADADAIVARLPAGLDTRLGEGGHGVSGGEARRLMIARALASGASVVMADEPTADLDAETAARVTDGLLALAQRGTTLIVATHDDTLAARMDRGIVLAAETGDAA